jgi:hypothetical protein
MICGDNLDREINIKEIIRLCGSVSDAWKAAKTMKPKGHELALGHYPVSRRLEQIGS